MNQDDYNDLEAELEGAINEVERLYAELDDAKAVIEAQQEKLDAIGRIL